MTDIYDTAAALQKAADLIEGGFDWESTVDGWDYWCKVHDKLEALIEEADNSKRSKTKPRKKGELPINDALARILLEGQGFKLDAKPRQSARSSAGPTAASPAASVPKAKPPSKAPKRKAAARGGRTLGQAMLLAHATSPKPGPKKMKHTGHRLRSGGAASSKSQAQSIVLAISRGASRSRRGARAK